MLIQNKPGREGLEINHSNSKSIGRSTILLGQWLMLKEHSAEMTFNREMR
jgi:hypothetical protein